MAEMWTEPAMAQHVRPAPGNPIHNSCQYLTGDAMKALVGRAEDLHLEVKEYHGFDDRMQGYVSQALSGFANSDGGVFILGLSTKHVKGEADAITRVKPFEHYDKIASDVRHLAGQEVMPLVDGVLVEPVAVSTPSTPGYGYVKMLVPASDLGPHRAMRKPGGDREYWKRSGDSFYRMELIGEMNGVFANVLIGGNERGFRERLRRSSSTPVSSREQIAKALHGDYRAEHLFALQQSLALYDTYRTMIAECDGHIEHCLAGFDARVDLAEHPLGPPKHGHRTPRGNAAAFDLRAHLYRIAGVDFTRIDGFDALTVQTILSEVGLDPSRFPSEKHFASWLALCPDNRVADRGYERGVCES